MYVVTANPAIQATEFKNPDGAAGDWFGGGLAATANYMVVGSPRHDSYGTNYGAAYIYERDGLGAWTQVAKVGPTGVTTGNFGAACAAAGDRVAVGSFLDNEVAGGAVYVYRRVGGVWGVEQKITNPDSAASYFGRQVVFSTDGLSLVVGAIGGTSEPSLGGSVWSFYWTGAAWSAGSLVQRADPASGDSFGHSVAISADKTTIIASAYADDDAFSNSGSVYVFTGTPQTGYVQAQKILSPTPGISDNFGYMVAIFGDVLAVSSLGPNPYLGRVHIFRRTAGVFAHVRTLLGSGLFATTYLGCITGAAIVPYVNYPGQYRLTMPDANTVLAPSPSDKSNAGDTYGTVWVFQADTTWENGYTQFSISGPPVRLGSKWGSCCDISGSKLLISSPVIASDATTVGSVWELDSVPLGGSAAPDTTPPAAVVVSPPEGPVAAADPLVIRITDNEAAPALVVIVATYPDVEPLRPSEVVWDGSAFRFPFLTSARQPLDSSLGHTYTIRRTNGWQASPTLRWYAVDVSGNMPAEV